MSEPRHLHPTATEPDPSVVRACEELLELAKSGKLLYVVARGMLPDNEAVEVKGGAPLDMLIGCAFRLAHDLADE